MRRAAVVLLLVASQPMLACRPPAPLSPAGLDAVAIFEQARAAHRLPDSLSCDAKAFVEAPEQGGRYPLHLAARRPASLRIEALTPLGDPAAVLVADHGRFALLDLRNNVFYRGPSTPENLARLLPAPLRDDELVALLLGGIPELPGAEPISAVREGGNLRLVLSTVPPGTTTLRGVSQEVLLGGDLRVLEVRRLLAAGSAGSGGSGAEPAARTEVLWSVKLDEHDDSSGQELPRLLQLEVPARKTRIDLQLRNLLVGKPPPAGAFLLGPPKGMQLVDLP